MKLKNKFMKSIKILFFVILSGSLIYVLFIYNHKSASYSEIINTKNINRYVIQEELQQNYISSEVINKDKCTYEINDDGEVILTHCTCDEDCLIINSEIDGYRIDRIAQNAFENNKNLETIKISKEISNNIYKIDNFEVSNILTDNEYAIYSTTKKYNENYLNYIKLSDEEKSKCEVIPEKFSVQINYTNYQKLYSSITKTSLPSRYDLRDNITVRVKDQDPFGLCFAYATLSSVETNIALNYNKRIVDFSEVHLSVRSKQGGDVGGDFAKCYSRYFSKGYGPIYENYYSKDEILERKNDRDKFIYSFLIGEISSQSEKLDQIINEMDNSNITPDFYVLSIKEFLGERAEKPEELVISTRKQIKDHIMKYGSIWTAVADPTDSRYYKRNSNGVYVMCAPVLTGNTAWHAVSIIGWDDNYKASNFPSELGVTQDGAWLILNSWGPNSGNNGCFWVSYQDPYPESYCFGVVEVSRGKVDVNNADISLSQNSYTYNGIQKRPDVTFKYHNNYYSIGNDYTLTYSNNTNAGKGQVTIKGEGRFTGIVTKEFTINRKEITEDKVNLDKVEFTYAGTQITPKVIVQDENKTLKPNVDYTIKYNNNVNAGTATATITGIGNYCGEIEKNFTILKKALTSDDIFLSQTEYTYDKRSKTPNVTVKIGNVTLKKDIDYNLTYKNNTNAGIANVTVTGIGNCSGQVDVTFNIKKAKPTYQTPTNLLALYGKKLADVKLPDNFSWEHDLNTLVGNVGYNTFKCKYTPEDTINYEIISGINVIIKVSKQIEVSINNYLTETLEDKNHNKISYVEKILPQTSLSNFKNNVITNGIVNIYDTNKHKITNNNEIIKTGMKLIIETDLENIEYTLVVQGDLTGDGFVNIVDLLKLSRYLAKLDINLSGAYYIAANVTNINNNDLNVDILDLLKLSRILAKLDMF